MRAMANTTVESEVGACMCAEFAGHKTLHNWGQPGCKHGEKEGTR